MLRASGHSNCETAVIPSTEAHTNRLWGSIGHGVQLPNGRV
jgi:hypothetical protein